MDIIGNFANMSINDKSIIRYANGHSYEGALLNGVRHGYGKYFGNTFGTPYIFEGTWSDGKKNGNFIVSYNGEITYEGTFENDKYQGYGKMKSFNNIYEGQYFDNNRQGYGKITYLNGSIYDGNWDNDCWHSYGVLALPSGNTYSGNFNYFKPIGIFTKIAADGQISHINAADKENMIELTKILKYCWK